MALQPGGHYMVQGGRMNRAGGIRIILMGAGLGLEKKRQAKDHDS